MAYVDPQTVHNPTAGAVIPASWGDTVRDDLEFLIDPPACSVYNSAVQVVASGIPEVLTADSENFDNDSMHSTSVDNSRITIVTAGRYDIGATVGFAADADGSRRMDIYVDGTDQEIVFNIPAGSAISTVTLTGSRKLVLDAGQYVEILVSHTAGNDLNVTLHEFAATFITR